MSTQLCSDTFLRSVHIYRMTAANAEIVSAILISLLINMQL